METIFQRYLVSLIFPDTVHVNIAVISYTFREAQTEELYNWDKNNDSNKSVAGHNTLHANTQSPDIPDSQTSNSPKMYLKLDSSTNIFLGISQFSEKLFQIVFVSGVDLGLQKHLRWHSL